MKITMSNDKFTPVLCLYIRFEDFMSGDVAIGLRIDSIQSQMPNKIIHINAHNFPEPSLQDGLVNYGIITGRSACQLVLEQATANRLAQNHAGKYYLPKEIMPHLKDTAGGTLSHSQLMGIYTPHMQFMNLLDEIRVCSPVDIEINDTGWEIKDPNKLLEESLNRVCRLYGFEEIELADA